MPLPQKIVYTALLYKHPQYFFFFFTYPKCYNKLNLIKYCMQYFIINLKEQELEPY